MDLRGIASLLKCHHSFISSSYGLSLKSSLANSSLYILTTRVAHSLKIFLSNLVSIEYSCVAIGLADTVSCRSHDCKKTLVGETNRGYFKGLNEGQCCHLSSGASS